MKENSIVKPGPFGNLRAGRVFYLPCDLPSQTLAAALGKAAARRRKLGRSSLYELDKAAVLLGALGAPAAALHLETLIQAGAKEVVGLGFCGSLTGRFRLGEVASIERALVDEGTSPHYFARKRAFSPSPRLKTGTEQSILAAGLTYKTGVIVSTDAPYRETPTWLEKSRNRGAELVDMETSALFALAAFHGVEAASLQIVSDELGDGGWKTGFRSPLVARTVHDYFLPLLLS